MIKRHVSNVELEMLLSCYCVVSRHQARLPTTISHHLKIMMKSFIFNSSYGPSTMDIFFRILMPIVFMFFVHAHCRRGTKELVNNIARTVGVKKIVHWVNFDEFHIYLFECSAFNWIRTHHNFWDGSRKRSVTKKHLETKSKTLKHWRHFIFDCPSIKMNCSLSWPHDI